MEVGALSDNVRVLAIASGVLCVIGLVYFTRRKIQDDVAKVAHHRVPSKEE